MPEPECFLRYGMHYNAEFYYVRKNLTYRYWASIIAAMRGFTMVLFTTSHGNNFVGGTCALPSALLVSLQCAPQHNNEWMVPPKHCVVTRLQCTILRHYSHVNLANSYHSKTAISKFNRHIYTKIYANTSTRYITISNIQYSRYFYMEPKRGP